MNITQKRESWIDFAKGLGILMVFFGHGKMPMGVWTVYIVHMPLFFFLSGYLFRCNIHAPGEFIRRKIKSLLIPYYVLGIPMLISVIWTDLVSVNWHSQFLGENYYQNLFLDYLTQKRFGTLWFIGTLFWMNLVMFLFVKYLKNNLILLMSVSMIMAVIGSIYYHLGGGKLPANLDIIFTMMFFFVLGYVMKEKNCLSHPLITNKPIWKWFLFMIISAVLGWANIALTHQHVDIFWNTYGFMPLMFLAAIIGLLSIVCLSQKIQWLPVRKLGQYSILFYAWHQCMIFIPVERWAYRHGLMYRNYETFFQRLSYTITVMALSLIIFSVVTFLIRKLPFRWIFGVK